MFALIKFSNNVYDVCQAKKVKQANNDTCIVQYKSGSRYIANLLVTNGNVKLIELV